jgi:hypothetical protein
MAASSIMCCGNWWPPDVARPRLDQAHLELSGR